MEINFWNCGFKNFKSFVTKKYDKKGKRIENKYDIQFIYGCGKNYAPEGTINICKLPIFNRKELKGNCSLL